MKGRKLSFSVSFSFRGFLEWKYNCAYAISLMRELRQETVKKFHMANILKNKKIFLLVLS